MIDTGFGAVCSACAALKIEINGNTLRVIVDTLLDTLLLRVSFEPTVGTVAVGTLPLVNRAP